MDFTPGRGQNNNPKFNQKKERRVGVRRVISPPVHPPLYSMCLSLTKTCHLPVTDGIANDCFKRTMQVLETFLEKAKFFLTTANHI